MDQKSIGGRYDLAGRIGRGGMAQVYLATDRLLGRQVAIKVLDRAFADDAAFVERFKREAQAAAALNHPNVVPIYEWGTVDDTYYIVMGYVPGQNLKETLRQSGPLSEAEALRIGAQVAGALEIAHQRGIIHRDIKPHNILLDPDGQVVVTDFGIARAAGSSQLTASNVILGTAEYLAPEQAQRDRDNVDGRADLYSLGIVLYELLTGRTPFKGESMMAVAWQHVHEQPPVPRDLGIHLSPTTEQAILKAIEKDPDRRFQTAAEMRDALTEARSGPRWIPQASPPLAFSEDHRSEPRPPEPRGGTSRGRTMIIATLALLLIVGAGIGFLLTRSPDATGSPGTQAGNGVENDPGSQGIASVSPSGTSGSTPKSTATASPQPAQSTAKPAATPKPSPSGGVVSTGAADPEAAVRRFYQLVGQHQFDQAAGLWSANMRAQYPPAQNITGRFSDTSDMSVQRAKAVSIDEGAGKATVEVDVIETVGSPGATRSWVGTWSLVRGPEGWLLDQPNLQTR